MTAVVAHRPPHRSCGRRVKQCLLAGQCLLVVLALVVAALSPRPGQAMLLVPIAGSIAPLIGTTPHELPVRLIAPGRLSGSMIVHADGDVRLVGLLMRGIVPVAAWTGACGRRGTIILERESQWTSWKN